MPMIVTIRQILNFGGILWQRKNQKKQWADQISKKWEFMETVVVKLSVI